MHAEDSRPAGGWSPGRSAARAAAAGGGGRRLGTNAYVSSMMLNTRAVGARDDRQGNGAWKAHRDAPSVGLLTGLAIPSMRRQWLSRIARWFTGKSD